MIPDKVQQLFKLSCRFKLCPIFHKSQIEVSRTISTSSPAYGKRNFRKFNVAKRGTYEDLKYFEEHPELEDQRGRRLPGHWEGSKFVRNPEMVPELIVPDLKDFPLKPYVSYRTADIEQGKFTPEHLFYAAYYKKLKKDFEEGKLDENGNSLEPSAEEKMDAEEAWKKARSSGSDLFG
ncbi:39S ribosomal protein L41, mitochondrial-like [Argiope bruennichi]|uniref:39S ribosomal protein L41 like protein n=1 Tax=Argiope bruennichi TaxID=94029 RepID=A0A8T0FY95_ARGBR|nr:39S ribosomal protein L41, mitochondrial-like [Argiope bruennichi]KAF8795722.1 39S ribosomal protein L41 like protein [Argiope bruennichi]